MVMESYDELYYDTNNSFCDREDDNAFGSKLAIFYYLIFVLSLLGNSLVLVIMFKFEKLTTVTNIFLLNLVLSGLVLMCSLPFWGVYHQLSNWLLGRHMCKLVGCTYDLGFYSSILFLTLMTVDRYLAVVYALDTQRIRRRSYAVAVCVGVWLISILASLKNLFTFELMDYRGSESLLCEEFPLEWLDMEFLNQWKVYLQMVLFFLLPLLVIVYCYSRIAFTVIHSKMVNKFRTVRLIFVIVLIFFACWTPYNVVLILSHFIEDCEQSKRLSYALTVTKHLTYLYFGISPVFYTFVGRKFQNHFHRLRATSFLRLSLRFSQSSKSNSLQKKKARDSGTEKTNDS